jgi:hypothetical protein
VGLNQSLYIFEWADVVFGLKHHSKDMGAGDSKEVEYDPAKDACRRQLDAYLECVEGKKGGLKEGDEVGGGGGGVLGLSITLTFLCVGQHVVL